MSLFGSIPVSASGIEAMQTWIDAIAGNLANINDAVPGNAPTYQEQVPVVAPDAAVPTAPGQPGTGVSVVAVALGSSTGKLAYDPSNPLADAQGYVRYPDVSLSQQLVDLVEAQQSYQANATAVRRAVSAYQSALTMGS